MTFWGFGGQSGKIRAGWSAGPRESIPWIFRLGCDVCGATMSAFAPSRHGPVALAAEARAWVAFIGESRRGGCPSCRRAEKVWRRDEAISWPPSSTPTPTPIP
jgi:hypothetical protein